MGFRSSIIGICLERDISTNARRGNETINYFFGELEIFPQKIMLKICAYFTEKFPLRLVLTPRGVFRYWGRGWEICEG